MDPQPNDAEPQEIAKAVTVRLGSHAVVQGPEGELIEIKVPSKYRLGRCLGQGGFGVVYLAQDTTLERRVALKLLVKASPAEATRFRREARFAARLDDPGIVKIYELGEHENQHYIAMQYVDGGNLRDAGLTKDEVVATLRAVALALGHAHEHGIVHRDIKPENILLDREGRSYVTDFGSARDIRGRGGGVSEGVIVGTPDLMAPEQARGESHRIDARTDVYALGATLYTLLTGWRPFGRPTLVETLYAVLHAQPPAPRRIKPDIPRGLEALTLKCMQKDPEDRYQSMAEVVETFDRFLAGEAVAGPGTRRLLRKATERAPSLTLGLEVAQEIAEWDTRRYRISSDITRTYPRLESLVERLCGILDARPDQAWARFYRGMALARLGRTGPALEDMERSIDRVGDLATAWFELGQMYLRLGLLEQLEPNRRLTFVDDADHLTVTEGYLDQARLAFEEAQIVKGDLSTWQTRYADAIGLLAAGDFGDCVAACDAIIDRDPDVEEVWKLRGDALRLSGADPVESYEQAVGIRRTYYEALHALGEAQLAKGDVVAARSALDRARDAHPAYVPSLVLRARLLLEQVPERPELAAALEDLERARQLLPLPQELSDAYAEEIETRRGLIEAAWIDQALEQIELARREGCTDRPLLQARGLLVRARHALAFGDDPRPDLDAVLKVPAPDDAAANQQWTAILEAAWRERARREEGS